MCKCFFVYYATILLRGATHKVGTVDHQVPSLVNPQHGQVPFPEVIVYRSGSYTLFSRFTILFN